MKLRRPTHLRLVEAPVSPEEHAQQRSWVQQAERRSTRSDERRDETAVQAKLYCLARARVENVAVFVPPEPPRAA